MNQALDARVAYRLFLGAAAVALSVGCEVEEPRPPQKSLPRLVPVRGTVRVEGHPLSGAVVVFLPVFSGSGTHSVGETRDDGSYELAHMNRPGTAPGEYRVAISYMVGRDGTVARLAARSSDVVPDEVNSGKELLPKRYSNLSQTELRAIVRDGSPPIDFDLVGPMPRRRTDSKSQSVEEVPRPTHAEGPAPRSK